MLTKTLAVALCTSAAAALALDAESDVHVAIGDTVNASVSNDDNLDGVYTSFAASDYFGCWFWDETKGGETWYWGTKMHIRPNMTMYSEHY